MLTSAFVVSVEKDRVLLRMPKPGGCGGSQLFAPKPHEFTVSRPQNLDLKPNDAVRILLPTGLSILSSFLIFILPLSVFAAVFIAAQLSFPSAPIFGTAAALTAGAISMVASLSAMKKSDRFRPTITEIVDGFVPPECSGCSQGCFTSQQTPPDEV